MLERSPTIAHHLILYEDLEEGEEPFVQLEYDPLRDGDQVESSQWETWPWQ